MPCLRATGLYSLSFISMALASWLPGPDPTPAGNGGFQLNLPEPTPAPEQNERGLTPRDNTDDSMLADTDYYPGYFDPTTSTSWAPASVCGYIDGLWSQYNSVACGDNRQCVFHTADSVYPGLVGCCDDNDSSSCLYETTCYDADAYLLHPSVDEVNVDF